MTFDLKPATDVPGGHRILLQSFDDGRLFGPQANCVLRLLRIVSPDRKKVVDLSVLTALSNERLASPVNFLGFRIVDSHRAGTIYLALEFGFQQQRQFE